MQRTRGCFIIFPINQLGLILLFEAEAKIVYGEELDIISEADRNCVIGLEV